MIPTATPPAPLLPPGSIAAMLSALPRGSKPSVSFREGACAILRLNRARAFPAGRAATECDALGVLFEQDTIDDELRISILDLLGTAGTPEAQIVMRRLLSLQIARQSSRTFSRYVQRLAFVERPDGATLQFLVGVYAESRFEHHDVRAACAYALGAAAGRAHVSALADAAYRATEALRRDLAAAKTTQEKCSLLLALGNASLEVDVPFFVRFTTDPDPHVRTAAAQALRRIHTSEARAQLLAMIESGDPSLSESAIAALFGQALTRKEIVRLAELVLAGRTPLALDGRILRLFVTQKLSSLSTPVDIVEETIQLLLSRMEADAIRSTGKSGSFQFDRNPEESGSYVRAMGPPMSVPPPPIPAPIEEAEEEEAPDTIRDPESKSGPRTLMAGSRNTPAVGPDPVVSDPVRSKSAFSIAVPFRPLIHIRGR